MRNTSLHYATIALFCLLSAGMAFATSDDDQAVDLSRALRLAREAQSRYIPISDNSMATARSQVDATQDALEDWLAANRGQIPRGLRESLKGDLLQTQLALGLHADQEALESVWSSYFAAQILDQEKPRFLAARASLLRYIDLLYLKTHADPNAYFAGRIRLLIEAIETYQDQPGTDQAAAIGRSVGYLQRVGQAHQLVHEIRDRFSQPNVYLSLSDRFVSAAIDRDVDETAPVRDVILGTTIHGGGRTTGRLTSQLIPNAAAAVVEIQLNAVNRSRTAGHNGPVTIHSNGTTWISARKRVTIAEDGIVSREASADCRTETCTTGIDAPPLVGWVARRQSRQQSGQAEWIAARHAEQRVANQLNVQVESALDDAQRDFRAKYRQMLLRSGSLPRSLGLSTTHEGLRLVATRATHAQLASATPPPPGNRGVDLALRLHESTACNSAETLLAGVELTDERLAEMLEEHTGEVPEDLRIAQDKPPWSITFAQHRPVSVLFDDDTVRISLRCRRMTRGDRITHKPLQISATYHLESTSSGGRYRRQDDVEVLFLQRRGRLDFGEIAMKTFVRNKFSALFQEEFAGDGLELQGQLGAGGKMKLSQFHANEGWLVMGWSLPGERPPPEPRELADSSVPAVWTQFTGRSVPAHLILSDLQWRAGTPQQTSPWDRPLQAPMQKSAHLLDNSGAR